MTILRRFADPWKSGWTFYVAIFYLGLGFVLQGLVELLPHYSAVISSFVQH